MILPPIHENITYHAQASTRILPSVLWRRWLGGRMGIQPVKTEWWGIGVAFRLRRGADLHMAQLMPLPLTISCSSKSTLVLPFWYILAHLGSPGQRAVKRCNSNRM